LHLMGWTLVHILYFYIGAGLLLLISRQKAIIGLFVWAGLIAVMLFAGAQNWSPEWQMVSHPLTFEFIGGLFVGLLPSPKESLAKILTAIAAVLLAALCVKFYMDGTDIRVQRPLYRAAIATPLIMFMIYALSGWKGTRPSTKWFSLAGMARAGFALYLTHILVIGVLGRLWRPFAMEGPWDNILVWPVIAFACLFFAMITERYFETPVANWIRRRFR